MRKPTLRKQFTKKTIDAIEPPEKGRITVYDEQVRDLGLRIDSSGRKSFFWLRKVNGAPAFRAIGEYPFTSVEQARGRAHELSGDLDKFKRNPDGPNPFEQPKKVPTLGEVCEHYVENHLKGHAKNPEHAMKYARWQFSKYLASWRNRPVSSIRRENIRDLHAEISKSHGEVTANRCVTFLRTLFNHAIHPDISLWAGANPCAKPKKFLAHEESRTRTIQREEAPKFFAELQREPHKDLRDVLLLALATGARRGSVLSLRWDSIDWQRELWIIPSPKGKLGRGPHIVPLTKLAVSVLKGRDRVSDWVFPGADKTRPLSGSGVRKPWTQFVARTGIKDLRLHDLRRSLATAEGETGASTEVIQKTLGHVDDSAATRIYDRSDRRDEVRGGMETGLGAILKAGKTSPRKLLKGA